MDPYMDRIWILYGSLFGPLNGSYMDPNICPIWIIHGSHMDPYIDCMDHIGSLCGSYMDPCKDPIWIPIWIPYMDPYMDPIWPSREAVWAHPSGLLERPYGEQMRQGRIQMAFQRGRTVSKCDRGASKWPSREAVR